MRFLCTTLDLDGDLSEAQLRRGIYQVLALESGHIEAQAQDAVTGFPSGSTCRSDRAGFLQHLLDVDAVARKKASVPRVASVNR